MACPIPFEAPVTRATCPSTENETAAESGTERLPFGLRQYWVMQILVTGSTDGLGRAAAASLLEDGHDVVIHARSQERLSTAADLVASGAKWVVGDLADLLQTLDVARQANEIGRMDAVIHNAGVGNSNPAVLPVNVVAPYVLTTAMMRPKRLVYLSSSMHRGGRADLANVDWTGTLKTHTYSDSKLFVTAFATALSTLWPGTLINSVDPGWVPTKMGGDEAPDDLAAGHRTQEWLATSDDDGARVTGGYWRHLEQQEPHAAVRDAGFQQELLDSLARYTGIVIRS